MDMQQILDSPFIIPILLTLLVFIIVISLKLVSKKNKKLPVPLKIEIADDVKNKKFKYDSLPKKCLITGGSGFVGKYMVDMLLAAGCDVKVFDLRKGDIDDSNSKVEFVQGNLCIKEDVERAVKGVECIFHVASPHAFAPEKILYAVNVDGTRNLVEAAIAAGVKGLVLTSSASIVFEGKDQKGVDESTPVPDKFRDVYCKTKAMSEAIVLEANGRSTSDGSLFQTCSIRPHGIFGPGDVQFFPVLVENAKKGKTKFMIGDGSNVVDFTYVGNVCHAHLLAAADINANANATSSSSKANAGARCGGKAYFITNGEPIPFWAMMSRVLVALGWPKPSLSMPYAFCLALSRVVDGVANTINALPLPINKISPSLNPSKVQIAGTYHYYSIKNAVADLGYSALWSMDEAVNISVMSFPELINPEALKQQAETETEKKTRTRAGSNGVDKEVIGPFTAAEVAKHNKEEDLWIIVDKKVYDVTDYVDDHPGGESILNNAGGDSTSGFKGPQHPDSVWDLLTKYYIGDVVE